MIKKYICFINYIRSSKHYLIILPKRKEEKLAEIDVKTSNFLKE